MPKRRSMCGLICVPNPRMKRPLLNACKSHAMYARFIGLRANAIAIADRDTRNVHVTGFKLGEGRCVVQDAIVDFVDLGHRSGGQVGDGLAHGHAAGGGGVEHGHGGALAHGEGFAAVAFVAHEGHGHVGHRHPQGAWRRPPVKRL